MERPREAMAAANQARIDPAPRQESDAGNPVLDVILLALKLLGERTMVALYHLIPLAAIAVTAGYAWTISATPTDRQLAALGIVALFSLALVWMTRKR